MRFLVRFGRFWYDFVVGDDWRLAVGTVAAIALTYAATSAGANLWWVLPVGVVTLLGLSVTMATRRRGGTSGL
jgi:hypothetical protein